MLSAISSAAFSDASWLGRPPAPATGPAFRLRRRRSTPKKLAPLLTPADAALAAAVPTEKRVAAGEDGSVLLQETLIWVAEDGITWRADHQIYRANTEAVAGDLGRQTNPFQPSWQQAYLPLARSLPPGGAWQNVRPDAAFVQSPQADADRELFTDRAELVVVFPQIRKGSVTEIVVLTEGKVARIPGQLTALFPFGGTWSSDLRRFVVELPAALAARLAVTPVGDPPAADRHELPDGRVRFEWAASKPAPYAAEPRMAPRQVTGPAVYLTTLAGWQELADWYRGLLAGRDALSPELRAQADEWSRDAKTPREVATALHRHVADDVRYTGLEFGIAGYQPKTPTEVWENLYGDCKDKANLLRALLAAKGIPSYLALVYTEHLGAIEKRSPDYRHFDHAILAIELPGEKEVFSPIRPFPTSIRASSAAAPATARPC